MKTLISTHQTVPPNLSKSITICIAARNEEGNLRPLLIALEETFQTLGFMPRVILIDDGSQDSSSLVLRDLQEQYSFLETIFHNPGQGLTGCLKTVVTHTDTDWLYLMPADFESDPRTDLPLLIEACQPGIDGVAGWRQGRNDGKNLASRFANLTSRLTFGIRLHDMNWIKLVRRDVLASLPLERVTHAYILPVMVGLGYNIIEVPTPWHTRKAGLSKFNSKRLLPSAIKFWKLWWWFYIESRLRPEHSNVLRSSQIK